MGEPKGRLVRRIGFDAPSLARGIDAGLAPCPKPRLPMPTWTLVLMVLYSTGPSTDVEPRAMTSIPGYTSEGECTAAGVAAMKLAMSKPASRRPAYLGPRSKTQAPAPTQSRRGAGPMHWRNPRAFLRLAA